MKQEETSPSQVPPVSAAEEGSLKREVLPLSKEPAAKRRVRKRWLAILLLVFFLFGIIFIVPADDVPLVRSLTTALGFSAEEAQQLSLAGILMTWGREGFPSATQRRANRGEGQQLLFDKYNLSGAWSASGPQTGLFDWQAVNASLRARGLAEENVTGVYSGLDRNQEGRAAVNHTVHGWTQQAQQAINAAGAQEGILFGEDADVAIRRGQENPATKGSADTFKLVQKSAIAAGASSDWLGMAIDKATLVSVGNLDAELQKAVGGAAAPLVNLNGSLTASDKPHRDLAQVWLLSKAATKAQQLMLKKQLAAAGYVAMEMPKKAYDSFGENSGIMMRGDEILADFQETNKELLSEEQCRDLAQSTSDTFVKAIKEAEELLKERNEDGSGGGTLRVPPTSCEGLAEWHTKNVRAMQQNCETRKAVLGNLSKKCNRTVKTPGTCNVTTTAIGAYVSQYQADCDALKAAKQAEAAAAAKKDTSPENYNLWLAAKDKLEQKQQEVDLYQQEEKKEELSAAVDESFGYGFFPEEDVEDALKNW